MGCSNTKQEEVEVAAPEPGASAPAGVPLTDVQLVEKAAAETEPWPDTPTPTPDMIPTAARQSRQPRHPTAPTVARQPPTANNIFLDRHHVRALSRTPRQLPDSPDSPDRPDTR